MTASCVVAMALNAGADDRRALVPAKRIELARALEQSLKTSRDSEVCLELSLRLARIYREIYLAELTASGPHASNWGSGRAEGASPPAGQLYGVLDKAILLYQELLNRYPKHIRRDEVLYHLGVALMDRGTPERAMGFLNELVRALPSSPFVVSALLQMGDYRFDMNQLALAEQAYDQLIARNPGAQLSYALHRKGWCAYRAGRPRDALRSFQAALANEERREREAGRGMTREILADLVLPFVELGKIDEAMEFYRARGRDAQRTGWAGLAELCARKNAVKTAVRLWKALLAEDETALENPLHEVGLARTLAQTGQAAAGLNWLSERAPRYLQDSAWKRANQGNPDGLRKVYAAFESAVWDLALDVLAERLAEGNSGLTHAEKQLFTRLLLEFRDPLPSPEARFKRGQICLELGRYDESAKLFEWAAHNSVSPKYRVEGLRYALVALKRSLDNGRPNGEADFTRAERVRAYVRLADAYLGAFPEAPDRAGVVVIKASLALEKLSWDRDYSAVITESRKLLDEPLLAGSNLRGEVAGIHRRAVLKRAQLLEQEGKFKEAAESYLAYVDANGRVEPELYDVALYNAAINFGKARDLESAVRTHLRLLETLRTPRLKPAVLLDLGHYYLLLGELGHAAAVFGRFATGFPRDPRAGEILRLVGHLQSAQGSKAAALAAFREYLERYPKGLPLVRFDIAELYGGAEKEELRWHQAALRGGKLPPQLFLWHSVRELELTHSNVREPNADRVERLIRYARHNAKIILGQPVGAELVAKLLRISAEGKARKLRALPLSGTEAELGLRLKQKLELLRQIEREYGRIHALGDKAWAQRASLEVALLYIGVLREVRSAPLPAGLSKVQLASYHEALRDTLIAPLERKALTSLGNCLSFADDSDARFSETARCHLLAAELSPEKFPRQRIFYLPPLLVALPHGDPVNGAGTELATLIGSDYPYGSAALFGDTASGRTLIPLSDVESARERSPIPIAVTYEKLASARRRGLEAAAEKLVTHERGASRPSTTIELSLSRLLHPERALTDLLAALRHDPFNESLHLLVGLAHLDGGNLAAARSTWLAMVARGGLLPAAYNNLGVAAYLAGREDEARRYWKEAAARGNLAEPLSNLGFLALKYRNGPEAKRRFEAARRVRKEPATEVGLAEALVLTDGVAAKVAFDSMPSDLKEDPYGQLAASYYYIDTFRDYRQARELLSAQSD